jgi:hypothetical protein
MTQSLPCFDAYRDLNKLVLTCVQHSERYRHLLAPSYGVRQSERRRPLGMARAQEFMCHWQATPNGLRGASA